jgi:tetratricopeptide (TPR) repeat protein|tara:strand:+ start:1955 stop:2335 length:381 start_codon:yes stop_codon:yes gene_type:complete
MIRDAEGKDLTFEIEFLECILREPGEHLDVLEMLAGYYTRVGRIDDGLALDQKLVVLQPDNATALYNLACSLALKERKAEAVARLREAIENGYDDFSWMLRDPDLNGLQPFPPFQALLTEFQIPEA